MEEKVFNTLVVCDTSSLGRSVGNYVLEEEGGELDGLVEDAMKMMGYGVRDVRNPMVGDSIAFSKRINFWIILIDWRVK